VTVRRAVASSAGDRFSCSSSPGEKTPWPWWEAILAALAICGAIGASRALNLAAADPVLRRTLGGFLSSAASHRHPRRGRLHGEPQTDVPTRTSLRNGQGMITPSSARDHPGGGGRGRRRGPVAGRPRAAPGAWRLRAELTAIRIALVAIVGEAVVISASSTAYLTEACVEFVGWIRSSSSCRRLTLVAPADRFGRYIYAIGGNPEPPAGRRRHHKIRYGPSRCVARRPPSAAHAQAPFC